jgi:hypothetical protein
MRVPSLISGFPQLQKMESKANTNALAPNLQRRLYDLSDLMAGFALLSLHVRDALHSQLTKTAPIFKMDSSD